MKSRTARIVKLAAYPLFYLFCLGLFGYLCFPFDQLRSRIEAEFQRMQGSRRGGLRSAESDMRLEIGELDGYWLSGVELRDTRLTLMPDPEPRRTRLAGGKTEADEAPPEPSVIKIDRAVARVQLLPLFIGEVRIKFSVEAFGGEINGTVPYGADSPVEVELSNLQLGEVEPLRNLTGLPVLGTVEGGLKLSPKDGKFSKADGQLDLRITRVVIGDGKASLQGVALPAAQVGDLTITAQATDGVLKLEELAAAGRDFELQGDGRIRLSERWSRSRADLFLRFKFTDTYRDKTDTTRSLLGAPGSKMPAALEFDPRIKRSKRADGFYAWHAHGPLSSLRFDPQSSTPDGGSRTRIPTGRKSARSPISGPRTFTPDRNPPKGAAARLGAAKGLMRGKEREESGGETEPAPPEPPPPDQAGAEEPEHEAPAPGPEPEEGAEEGNEAPEE